MRLQSSCATHACETGLTPSDLPTSWRPVNGQDGPQNHVAGMTVCADIPYPLWEHVVYAAVYDLHPFFIGCDHRIGG